MKLKYFVIASLSVLVSITLAVSFIAGCGVTTGGGGAGHGTITYYGTQSPGDAWAWTIKSSTFIGTNETTGNTYWGDYIVLPSGFYKGTIVGATTDEVSPDDVGYFMEIPNTALLVKPMGAEGTDEDRVIICAAAAAAGPAGGNDYPYIRIPDQTWAPTGETSYGISTSNLAGGVYTFEVNSWDYAGDPVSVGQLAPDYTFADGKLTSPVSSTEIYMTPSGVFIGDEGEDLGGFAGGGKSTDPSITVEVATGRNYRGVIFHYNITTGSGSTDAIGAREYPSMPGVIQGWTFDDVDTQTGPLTEWTTLEFTDFSDGFAFGTLRDTQGFSNTFKMLISNVGTVSSPKYLIFGISIDGDGNPQNFLVIETD